MPALTAHLPLLIALATLVALVIITTLTVRAWRRGRAVLARQEKMRRAEEARERRKEKRAVRERESAITPLEDASRHQARRSVVLVVEDSELIRKNLRRALEDHAYRVITAENGHQAWAVLQDQRPDLVISDIEMPHVNGLQLLRLVRADLTLADLPFMLITGYEEHSTRAGQDAGASGFLRKPYKDQDLIDQVRYLLQE